MPAARGERRVALRLLRRVRDYAQVMSNGHIEREIAHTALVLQEIDELGAGRSGPARARFDYQQVWRRPRGAGYAGRQH
ncbi:MAG: hypothetical protein R3A44_34745 [Caldilineaceae bacterium]